MSGKHLLRRLDRPGWCRSMQQGDRSLLATLVLIDHHAIADEDILGAEPPLGVDSIGAIDLIDAAGLHGQNVAIVGYCLQSVLIAVCSRRGRCENQGHAKRHYDTIDHGLASGAVLSVAQCAQVNSSFRSKAVSRLRCKRAFPEEFSRAPMARIHHRSFQSIAVAIRQPLGYTSVV
jgi:hypothetical protein